VFYRDIDVEWTISYYDLQAESSAWLFKSPPAGGGAYCVGPVT